MNNIYEKIENLFKQNSEYLTEDNTLLKTKIYEDCQNLEPKFIKILLTDDYIKKYFFIKINDVLVFNKEKFVSIINYKNFLPDSYTKYCNKIGLTHNNKFISKSNDVVLDFPYKDCVLAGGQTKEDQKREDCKEVVFNELIASDEITRMLAPKVFTNAKRYTKDAIEEDITFNEDDNLIIKGNNLIALSSILEKYEGKVKCIYIDPPYYFKINKPSNTFSYNSNFKLSSWLLFIKNRLEYARKLLSNDGIIFCHINEEGIHYLKLLIEEIFGKENFIETFIWKNTDNPDSISKKSRSSVEYIICYEKVKDLNKKYIGKISENCDTPLLNTGNNIKELRFPKGTIKFNIDDGFYDSEIKEKVELLTPFYVKDGLNDRDIILKGEFRWSQENLDKEIKLGTYFIVKSEKFSIRFQKPSGNIMAPEKYLEEKYLSKVLGVGTNEDANSHLKSMKIDFSYSKPETIVSFFINAVTNKNDLVLDFFVGSGTTCAVAHKMGRRYIGIEQMDYINDITVARLEKVIQGEQGGISKSANWQGGGSFVYCELKENAYSLIELVKSTTEENIDKIKEKIFNDDRIVPYIRKEDLEKASKEFEENSLDEKKKALITLIDKNKLYVNFSDINDEDYKITESERKFTNSFYKGV